MTRNTTRSNSGVCNEKNYLSKSEQRFSQADALTKVDTSIPRKQFRENIRKASSILFGTEE